MFMEAVWFALKKEVERQRKKCFMFVLSVPPPSPPPADIPVCQ